MIKYLLGTTKRKLQNRYSVMQDTEEFKRKIAEVGKRPQRLLTQRKLGAWHLLKKAKKLLSQFLKKD